MVRHRGQRRVFGGGDQQCGHDELLQFLDPTLGNVAHPPSGHSTELPQRHEDIETLPGKSVAVNAVAAGDSGGNLFPIATFLQASSLMSAAKASASRGIRDEYRDTRRQSGMFHFG